MGLGDVYKRQKEAGFGQIIVSLQPDARSMLEAIVPLMRIKLSNGARLKN